MGANVKTLTKKIYTHLKLNSLSKAVSTLFESLVPVDNSLYASLFKLCAERRAIIETRKLESHLLTFTLTPPIFLLNRAIEAYGKCACLDDARELFDEMPHRDGGSWNALISAYALNGFAAEALRVFLDMKEDGFSWNEVSFASVLKCCASLLEIRFGMGIHGVVVKSGYSGNVIIASSIIDVYGKGGFLSEARRMFDDIVNPNEVSWNVIIRRHYDMCEEEKAVGLFFEMVKRNEVMPLSFTVSNALRACSRISAFDAGLQIHAFAIKINVVDTLVVSGSLIDMYSKYGDLQSAHNVFNQPNAKDLVNWTSIVTAYAMNGRTKEARELFNEMPERNIVSYNAMLAGYTQNRKWEEALEIIHLISKANIHIDHVTIPLILTVCAGLLDIELGKKVHGYVYRRHLNSDIFVGNGLLNMYGKCGDLRSCRAWFYQMSRLRDAVSWNSILTSHARHKRSEEVMMVIWKMLEETPPNKHTLATILAACANIFALDATKQIHGFLVRNGYDIDIVMKGAIIDAYSKCRCLMYALTVFKATTPRDLILYNSMILGCCHNLRGDVAIDVFDMLKSEGLKPDNTTFQGVLLACICEGRVELGRAYFEVMNKEYCVIPRLEHYESMIELYARYGYIGELENFVKQMPFDPTASMLIRVFDACLDYKHERFGKWAADRLNDLNPSVPFRFELMDHRRMA
ncbi:putative tetratricopeptide-like helical domain superfamily [Helianthus annuus]|uniref:Putative tetratricopeptide repeat (TPR)-like superfamily protein n=1 Tax=Helianthus annuus TaxID=4232 RepID=A0A251SFG2_HELAN|nr:pentatricopeptide repeat-containing protein At3g26540 [Helianthus annuus]KAF5767801.1 putative tetratricopeptide-like helical domain superfamily [Helianthus annuus]KAJ0463263.1 putative tetratricopeptide-like helical domain superfamily [Helianthus annuus]KAJ0467170.1 putative tetratricopeptide-like helical domain superfamily [Helianthus annuus]KAJ0484639.1 putative tetratricopeptide-like helical domain superfamily [Helianthus annuus]KAJ0655193.1 putative tetratricopeptide-like helical domai